uniref:Uncharacterized protein n=1 Tax=Ditylenchus dipsaci TaxID=166011 RepID=A0A915DV28_9BILA
MFLRPRYKDRFAVDKVKFNINVATWIQEESENNINVCDAVNNIEMKLLSIFLFSCLLISACLTILIAAEEILNVKSVFSRVKRDPVKPSACENACHQKAKGEAYYECVKKDCGYHR